MPVIQLTPDFIRNITTLEGKSRTEWCDKNQPGLYCEARATAPGDGTYYLRYKDKGGKTRHFRLGTTKQITLVQARAMAKEKQAEVRLGADPSGATKARKEVPTLRQFATETYIPFIRQRNRSYKDCINRMNFRLLPKFGDRKLSDISRHDIIAHLQDLKEEQLAAASVNHVGKLLRRMLNVSIDMGIFSGPNVCAKLPLYREDNFTENMLSDAQLARLMQTIDTHPNRTPCLVLKWLLSTGARLGETLLCSYDQINFETNSWLIPSKNSKSRRRHLVPLNESAMEVLQELAHDEKTGFLFRNSRTGERLKTLNRAFNDIKKVAGLTDIPFRIHDCRHNHAKLLIDNGCSMASLKEILGHSSYLVTEKYLHLSQNMLHNASSTVHDTLKKASSQNPSPPKRPLPPLKLVSSGH